MKRKEQLIREFPSFESDEAVYREIFEAIKVDDEEKFDFYVKQKGRYSSLCYGRFPLLSVCYLYGSENIINLYEKELYAQKTVNKIEEYYEIYKLFKQKAKKCLRLYLDEESIVAPAEMLAVLNYRSDLQRTKTLFESDLLVTEKVDYILKTLYKRGKGKRSYGRTPLAKYKTAIVASIIVVAMLLGCLTGGSYYFVGKHYGVGNEENPIKISAAQIEKAFSEDRYYILTEDIALSPDRANESFSGKINADGHTISMKSIFAKDFKGEIKNAIIDLGEGEINLTETTSLFVGTNNGVIKDCQIKYTGKLTENSDVEDLYFAVLCNENNGEITNVTMDVKIDFHGDGIGNAYLSSIAVKNNNTISECTIADTSMLHTNTVDVASIVAENGENAKITDCVNKAEISQTTASSAWNPNVAGIVLNNRGTINGCYNEGKIFAETTTPVVEGYSSQLELFVGGIAALNYSQIMKCKSSGEVSAAAGFSTIYLGGIVGANANTASVENAAAIGTYTATLTANVCNGFVGGICGYNAGKTQNNYFSGELTDAGNEYVILCGISGVVSNASAVVQKNYYLKGNAVAGGCILYWGSLYDYSDGTTALQTMDEIMTSGVYW